MWPFVAISGVSSPVKQRPTAEIARWLLLFATDCWLFHPFMTGRQIGSGDALWYANMLADFVTQWRAGVFPVFVGQTDFAFNGAVYPLRVAPLYQHLAGVIDLLTARQLGFFALQHAAVILCGFAGLAVSYLTLGRLAPSRRWAACGLSVLYVSCPGVLGTIYTQDLYMTWMTIPFLPVVIFGLVRTFDHDTVATQVCLAAGLAALWLAHSPVALWMTLIAGGIQLYRLCFLHRQKVAWQRAAIGALVFAALAHYPFVSVASLHVPGAASAVTSGLTQQERITQVIHEVFPAVLFPLSENARQLSDLQLGYAWWIIFFFSATLAVRPGSSWPLRLLVLAAAGLLVLLLPVPGVTDWLWQHLPGPIKRITFYWPMHRFYLLLAALLAAAGLLAFVRLGARGQRIAGIVLIFACSWGLWESRQFIGAGRERTASPEMSLRSQRPENRLLMNHSYGLFPGLPSYFSNGVMDPRTESRLLSIATLAPLPSPAPGQAAFQPLIGSVDANPGVLLLQPTLRLEPGRRYELKFVFGDHDGTGILQLAGPTFFREYVLPESGQPHAFGTQRNNSPVLSLWTTANGTEEITLRFIPTRPGAKPAEYKKFARFSLREIPPGSEAIKIISWLPYRATVRPAQASWLETPRVFIPGYTATIDGRTEEVRRSPEGLATVPVTSATRQVELRYQGPVALRLAYGLSLITWAGLIGMVVRRYFRNQQVPLLQDQ